MDIDAGAALVYVDVVDEPLAREVSFDFTLEDGLSTVYLLNRADTGDRAFAAAIHEAVEPSGTAQPRMVDPFAEGELAVAATPACADASLSGAAVSADTTGGTGLYQYAWSPVDGVTDPTSPTPSISPDGIASYTVTVDDGLSIVSDVLTVVDADPLDLQGNCTLYKGDHQPATPDATIAYESSGTVACEQGNNDFGLHLCENVVFENVELVGTLEVRDTVDDDMVGLVWGAQHGGQFYSLSWKRALQGAGSCVPAGIVVKRLDAPDFASLTSDDMYCESDTAQSVPAPRPLRDDHCGLGTVHALHREDSVHHAGQRGGSGAGQRFSGYRLVCGG